jgi:hypothetical protein
VWRTGLNNAQKVRIRRLLCDRCGACCCGVPIPNHCRWSPHAALMYTKRCLLHCLHASCCVSVAHLASKVEAAWCHQVWVMGTETAASVQPPEVHHCSGCNPAAAVMQQAVWIHHSMPGSSVQCLLWMVCSTLLCFQCLGNCRHMLATPPCNPATALYMQPGSCPSNQRITHLSSALGYRAMHLHKWRYLVPRQQGLLEAHARIY